MATATSSTRQQVSHSHLEYFYIFKWWKLHVQWWSETEAKHWRQKKRNHKNCIVQIECMLCRQILFRHLLFSFPSSFLIINIFLFRIPFSYIFIAVAKKKTEYDFTHSELWNYFLWKISKQKKMTRTIRLTGDTKIHRMNWKHSNSQAAISL